MSASAVRSVAKVQCRIQFYRIRDLRSSLDDRVDDPADVTHATRTIPRSARLASRRSAPERRSLHRASLRRSADCTRTGKRFRA